LLEIIQRVPNGGNFLAPSDRRQNAFVIYFPSLDGTRPYVLTRTIGLPGTKSIQLTASAPFGARIEVRPAPQSGRMPPPSCPIRVAGAIQERLTIALRVAEDTPADRMGARRVF